MTEQQKNTENSPHFEETAETATPMKRKKSRIRTALCVGSAVVFVPVFGLLGALATDAGQRGLLQLADRWVDGLSIGHISGGLQQGLVLDNLRYQTAGIDTHIAQARLQLDFGCLWSRKICLQDFTLTQPTIAINTARLPPSEPTPPDNSPIQRLNLPIALDAANLSVNDLTLKIDDDQIALKQFHSAMSLNNTDGLTIAPTQINDLTVQTTQTAAPEPVQQETAAQPIDWAQIEQSLTPPLLGNLSDVVLPFDLHVPSITGANWQYQTLDAQGQPVQDVRVANFTLQADTQDNQLQLQQLAVDSSLGNLKAQGDLQLNGDFALNLHLQSHLNALESQGKTIIPASDVNLTLGGSLKKTTALSLQTTGLMDATLNAQAQLTVEKTPLTADLHIKQAAYAFVDDMPPLKIENVALKLNGDLLAYHAELQGSAEGMNHVPQTQVNLNADGKIYEVTVNKLDIAALGGDGLLSGYVHWKDGAFWDVAADLNKMNIRPYVPALPAVLSGKLQSKGFAGGTQGWQVDVPVMDLSGTLSARPVSLKGAVLLNHGDLLNIPDLQLNYAENKIHAKGVLGDNSDLALNIQAPNLQGLWGDLRGGVVGTAQLSGKLDAPNVTADLTSSRLQFQGVDVRKAIVKGNIVSEPILKGQLNVKAAQLDYGDSVKLRALDLAVSGDENKHQLTLQAQGEPLAANVQINGHFDRTLAQWNGTLAQAKFGTPIGDVKTNQAVAVSYDNNKLQAHIAAHCWQNVDVDLCFPQAFDAGVEGNIPFNFKRIDLALVNKLLQQESLRGTLQAQGDVAWFKDKPFRFNGKVQGREVSVAQKLDYRTFKLTFPTLTLDADIQNNNLTLKSNLNVQNQGRIVADLRLNDLAQTRQLGGTLAIERLNLGIANQLFTDGEQVNGEVVSKLNLSGNLLKPLVHGELRVRDLRAQLKSLPFEIKRGEISLRFDGNRSTLQGRIDTEDSALNLRGHANWADLARWSSEIQAQAENFKLDIPSMAKIRVSPNVTVRANPRELDLSGNIDIPWARIQIDSLPENAEPVSPDEVILNGPHKSKESLIKREFAAETQSGMAIRSDLRIHIGKDVQLDAYGLKTHLNGLLAVQQDKGRLGLFGQINLEKGRYASFGQDLIIRKGQISFSGEPSQPMLDIVAVRNPEAMEDSNVTAGVRVVGVADSPEVTVFTEPGKPQDQALSYLLTGRSLENSGEAGSGGSVGAALLGMGLAKSGKLVGGIGETFGIQDLNLGTSGVGDKSKVTVSGNLTNRLQIKYGVGLFDGLAEVTLRYRLMPQLYFQSVSGANQVFDLLYQFEF